MIKRIIVMILALGLVSWGFVSCITSGNSNNGQISPNDATTTAVVATTNAESTQTSSNEATLNAVATQISSNEATPNAVATQINAESTQIIAELTQTSSCGR